MESRLKVFWVFLLLFASIVNAAGQNNYTISGNIADSFTKKALAGAKVELLVDGGTATVATSNSDGHFSLRFSKPQTFQLRVGLDGYHTYMSASRQINLSQPNYDAGTILLTPAGRIISTDTLIQNKMVTMGYVPTKGATDLFYALNPELKGQSTVPANYTVKYPELPKFKPTKKKFNKRYKKDKKRNGPYIYTYTMKPGGTGDAEMTWVPEQKQHLNYGACATTFDDAVTGKSQYYYAKTKKFVFVFFKLDANNKPQYELNKYRVVYYSDDMRGNPGEYNQSGDATYGYALLRAHIYVVEVYDQSNNRQMRISDNTVDPNRIIQRFDLYNKWNKILIQVYD